MSREMKTYRGHYFDVLHPDPDKIEIEDIAWSLSTMCRFNGHIGQFYSVAEHCITMSYLVPEEFAMEALLHDAGEAYMGDIIFPVKHMLDQQTGGLLTRIEDKLVYVIMEKLMTERQFKRVKHTDSGIYRKSPAVQAQDKAIVRHEWAYLGKGDEHNLNEKIVEVDYQYVIPLISQFENNLADLPSHQAIAAAYRTRYSELLEEDY